MRNAVSLCCVGCVSHFSSRLPFTFVLLSSRLNSSPILDIYLVSLPHIFSISIVTIHPTLGPVYPVAFYSLPLLYTRRLGAPPVMSHSRVHTWIGFRLLPRIVLSSRTCNNVETDHDFVPECVPKYILPRSQGHCIQLRDLLCTVLVGYAN